MSYRNYALAGAAILAVAPAMAMAQSGATDSQDRSRTSTRGDPARSEPADEKPATGAKDDDDDRTPGATNDFAGLKFGVGISFTLANGDRDRVSDASIVNGIVRVNDEDNGRARIMLESHYFFTPGNPPEQETWGVGPFIALQPGTKDIIESVGIGVMVGFRRGTGDESFNLGIGAVVDPNTRVLGDGIVADLPLPPGETNVRYKEEMQTGILIISSFSF